MLLARADEAALRELCERHRANPDRLVNALDRLGVAGYASELLAASARVPGAAALVRDLEQPILHLVARAAQRRRALDHLDALAIEHGVRPLLIKGASTARRYYPHVWLRPSVDIDIVMGAADIERFIPGTIEFESPRDRTPHHLDRRVLDRVAIEIHYRFNVLDAWGMPEDLLAGAEADVAYTALRHPSPVVAVTLALLHFRQHSGRMPWDLIDAALIARSPGFDWDAAWRLWAARGLVPHLIAPLILLERVTGLGEAERLQAAWRDADSHTRRHARLLLGYVVSRRWRFVKGKRLDAMLRGVPFHRFAWRALLGSPDVTARLSGLSRRDLRFWLDLLVVHPLRRVWHVLFGVPR